MAARIEGQVEPGFEAVRDAFARNFEEGREVGAAVCVHVNGRKVVDLQGGSFDADGTRPYDEESLQLVFSTTKGITAIAAAILMERGLLDVDAPVAEYWPEFATEGKEGITVAQLLGHRAGLVTIEPALSLEQALDWATVTKALVAQQPAWEPGTAHGYHALTYGWLVGEVLRRISGKGVGELVQAEICGPVGAELWIGLPDSEEARVSPMVASPPPPPEMAAMMEEFMGPSTLGGRALLLSGTFSLDPDDMVFNRREVHAAEIPAANAITNARALSRIYAATIGELDGVRLLSSDTVDRARTPLSDGPDRCLLVPTTFGLGFMLTSDFNPMTGTGAFGHPGAGGSIGFAHPETGIALGYVMNQMDANLAGDPRVARLAKATLASL